MATIYGTSGADNLTDQATGEADTIYGYDPNASEIVGTRIASALTQPLFVTGAPDDSDRLFIVGKQGTVQVVGADGTIAATPFLDVRNQVSTAGEVGLLGFTFHPDFANNGKVYVFMSLKDVISEGPPPVYGPQHNQSQIREYTVNPNSPNALDPNDYKVILETTEYTPYSGNHRAGWIGFSPEDGCLYAAIGDGDQNAKSQDPTSLLGKILRLDVNGPDAFPADPKKNYAIPVTNPTVFDNASDLARPSEVYAIGFRNPWRASFDKDGRLFVGDVGADTAEEINLVVPGANYGWGRQDNGGAPDDGPTPGEGDGYTDPIHSYLHSDNIGSSVTGGYVYNGPIPALKGKYIFGDFGSGRIWALEETDNGWVRTDITSMIVPSSGTIERIASFGTDKNGNLYVVDITGEVFRLDAGNGGPDLGDTLAGGGGDDVVYGGGGNDIIHGDDDDDHLYGEADDDHLHGDAGADTLEGGAGNDHLYGGAGADTLEGGAGNDVYYVDGADTVVEAGNGGIDTVEATENYALGANVENLVLRGTAPIEGIGNSLDNQITGNDAANYLDGGAGADTLKGGAGEDTYVVDGSDTVTEAEDEGIDTVEANSSYVLGANVENLILAGTTAANGTGNDLDNEITGSDAINILIGGAGADTLHGAGGNDTLDGGTGSDTLYGGAGDDTYILNGSDAVEENENDGIDTVETTLNNYTLADNVENLKLLGTAVTGTGNGLNNRITGNAEVNFLFGNDGADTLEGGVGADLLDGGAGDDTYIVDAEDEISDGGGEDTVISSDTYSLEGLDFIENLRLAGTAAINGTGNAEDNKITGNGAANVLDGGGSDDTLDGGLGIDTAQFRFDQADYEITDAGNGYWRVSDRTANRDGTSLITNIEFLKFADGTIEVPGAVGPINGTPDPDVLPGTADADTINGGAGNDTVNGGDGDDIIHGGDDDDSLYGEAEDDELYGDAGADVLEGGGGEDTLSGGGGNDTYLLRAAADESDQVVEDANAGIDTVRASFTYALTANVENLILEGSGNISGIGNEIANQITGNAGNNILDGGDGGIDTLTGGAGNDIYYVGTGDRVIEAAGEGADQIRARASFTLQGGSAVETIGFDDITNLAALNLTGNELAQVISGSAGDNILNGGGGADTLGGFGGNDTYIVDGDDVIAEQAELAGGGIDTVLSSASHTLGAFIEHLTLTGAAAVNATGNELANMITGNDAANVLDGGAGVDTLRGMGGNDTYVIRDGDVIEEAANAGVDTVQSWMGAYVLGANLENLTLMGGALNGTGNGLANVITGNNSNNVLIAGDGNDRLVGGLGKDTFTGGKGKDVFVFDDKETGSSKTKADYITDFRGKEGDRIDLKLVDADAKKRGDQKFAFIGKEAFTKAGQVRYEKTKKETFVYLNTDNDKAAEAVIKLKGAIDLSKGWFVL